MRSLMNCASIAAVVLCVISLSSPALAVIPYTVDINLVGTSNSHYATFQSHNQQVVSNENGIFVAYVSFIDRGEINNVWRLAQSTDGGATFTTVYQETISSRVPSIEVGENGDLYLAAAEMFNSNGTNAEKHHFYKFEASNGYSAPTIHTETTNAKSWAKHSMTYDPIRQQVYIGNQTGKFLTVDTTNGNWVGNVQLLNWPNESAPEHSYPQYPVLKMDDAGAVHYGWTTVSATGGIYRNSMHMQSPDGGATWETIAGVAIDTSSPIVPDETGPATEVNLVDERGSNTWLANMLPKDGKVHMFYNATALGRMHYVRYDQGSGAKDIDTGSTWQGSSIYLSDYNGFFATDRRYPNTPLYAVARDSAGYIAALVSDDNGATWDDYARSSTTYWGSYAIGGFNNLDPNGNIVGYFTDSSGGYNVRFLSIPTTAVTPHDGDADNDGDVDIFDYMAMTAAYGQAGTSQWRWVEGDFDEDGDVDIFDYMAMTAEYGWTEGGGGSIPEPASLAILAIGGLCASVRRRKR